MWGGLLYVLLLGAYKVRETYAAPLRNYDDLYDPSPSPVLELLPHKPASSSAHAAPLGEPAALALIDDGPPEPPPDYEEFVPLNLRSLGNLNTLPVPLAGHYPRMLTKDEIEWLRLMYKMGIRHPMLVDLMQNFYMDK